MPSVLRSFSVLSILLISVHWSATTKAVLAVAQDDDWNYNPKRGALWKALRTAFPNDLIDVYCENPALTELIFRSQEKTMLFTLNDKKTRKIEIKKKLEKINRITFQKDKKGEYSWVLWHDGKVDFSTQADKAGVGTGQVEESNEEDDKKRAELWAALRKDFPQDEIDVYTENPSLTEVAFRSGRATMRFFLKTGKAGRIEHMKGLRWINRITFCEQARGGHWYILWLDGDSELLIAAVK